MATDKMGIEPLRCCGVTPWGFEIEGNLGRAWYRLICPKCGIHFTAPSKEKAIDRWNKKVVTSLWQRNG
jgi:hypothetical protein